MSWDHQRVLLDERMHQAEAKALEELKACREELALMDDCMRQYI